MKIHALADIYKNELIIHQQDGPGVYKANGHYFFKAANKNRKLISFFETPLQDKHGQPLCEGDVVTYRNCQHVILRKNRKSFYLDALNDTEGRKVSGKHTIFTKDVANGCELVMSIDKKRGVLTDKEAEEIWNDTMPVSTLKAKLDERDFQAAF